jgi:hypothetical protein
MERKTWMPGTFSEAALRALAGHDVEVVIANIKGRACRGTVRRQVRN